MYDIKNLSIWKNENTNSPLSESPSLNISYPGGAADIHTGKALADTEIEELNLSVRAYNCLRRAGCGTVGDVLRLAESSENGLMKIRNLGTKSAKEIMTRIEEMQESILQKEQTNCFRQNKKKLIKPSGKLLDRPVEGFALTDATRERLRSCGIRVARDLYKSGSFSDPGWFAVRELFEEMQRYI